MASLTTAQSSTYDRQNELKSFDEAQLGVKGLVDKGLSKVPLIFINHQDHNRLDEQTPSNKPKPNFTIPTIDLADIENDPKRLKEVVAQIWDACENWGFFQIINHGIPQEIVDEMLSGVRRFHELDAKVKKNTSYHSRDAIVKKFAYFSNYFLYNGPVTNWKDTISILMSPNPPQPEQLPIVCRDIALEYTEQVKKLGQTLFELISRALGLSPTQLKDMECDKDLLLLGHYYPPCPEPNATIGFSKHADNDVLTILNQDQIGGLQVWHQNTWVDVPYVPGALVINTGDLLQIKSVYHRVVAKEVGPRVSLAAFFKPHSSDPRLYGPIKGLISKEHPPIYKETTIKDYLSHYTNRGQDGSHVLEEFKLSYE